MCGSPIQKYYSDKKIEKSAGSFCGQKYSIDKSITNRLLAGFSALIFRNQNPAYTIKKRKGETLIYWRNSKFGTEWIHLLASCTVALDSFNMAASAPRPCLRCSKVSAHCCCGCCAHYCVVCIVRYPQRAQYLVLSLVAQVEIVVDSEVGLLLPRARVDAARITEQQRCQDMWRQKRTR